MDLPNPWKKEAQTLQQPVFPKLQQTIVLEFQENVNLILYSSLIMTESADVLVLQHWG